MLFQWQHPTDQLVKKEILKEERKEPVNEMNELVRHFAVAAIESVTIECYNISIAC